MLPELPGFQTQVEGLDKIMVVTTRQQGRSDADDDQSLAEDQNTEGFELTPLTDLIGEDYNYPQQTFRPDSDIQDTDLAVQVELKKTNCQHEKAC